MQMSESEARKNLCERLQKIFPKKLPKKLPKNVWLGGISLVILILIRYNEKIYRKDMLRRVPPRHR